jgi:ribose transport system substrate-binding protein
MDRTYRRIFAGAAAVALAVTSVGSALAQDESAAPAESAPAAGGDTYRIGMTNWLAGNGWREEMRCSIRAEALNSGRVSELVEAHRTTDAAGQLEDLNNLINAGVDAIIINPISPDAFNDAIGQATEQGIPVVAVDLAVTAPDTYLFSNDQEEYGYLGAKWLFEQLGGEGAVFYMRGAAGTSADTDRDNGFKRAMEEYPGITIAQEVFTNWDQPTGTQQTLDMLASGIPFDGIWTSGIDSVVVDALKQQGAPFVPIVGADNSGFVNQLLTEEGLVGAAVTNSAAVGGAGLNLAIKILDGQAPAEPQVKTTPVVWDNVTDEGKAALTEALDADVVAKDPFWPLVYSLPPDTTYSKEQILACAEVGA